MGRKKERKKEKKERKKESGGVIKSYSSITASQINIRPSLQQHLDSKQTNHEHHFKIIYINL